MRSTVFAVFALSLATVCVPAGWADGNGYEEVEVQHGGSVAGRVTFAGTPPVPERLVIATNADVCGTEALSRDLLVGPGNGIRNVVVYLRDVLRGKAWEEREHTLGQKACRFEPHVMLFREGADLHILNDDRIAHGVRTYGKDSVFNVGQPKFVLELLVEDFTKKVTERKAIRIGCDLHPWMRAFVFLQEHPYYAITGEDGSYELTDVPPGQYQLDVWHETLGETARRVTVEANQETTVNFELGH